MIGGELRSPICTIEGMSKYCFEGFICYQMHGPQGTGAVGEGWAP